MEMRLTTTSLGATIPIKSKAIGLSAFNGLHIKFKQGPIIRQFVMHKPVSLNKDGTFGVSLLGTKWFKVRDPDRGVMIKEFHGKTAQIEVSPAYGFSNVDIKLTIFDDQDQPWYTIEKINIPSNGYATTGFRLRAKLIHGRITYHGKIKKP